MTRSRMILIAFVAGLLALDALVARHQHLWRAHEPNHYRDRLEGCRQQRWDLVVVGGSPAMAALDPSILAGLRWNGQSLDRVYNLALPLATSAEVYHSTIHGLSATPRLLVYGVCATDFKEDRVEPLGPMFLMDGRDLHCWWRERSGTAGWCLYKYGKERLARLWQLYYYRNGIRLWAAEWFEQFWPGSFQASAEEARDNLRVSNGIRAGHGFIAQTRTSQCRLDHLKSQGTAENTSPFLENYCIGNSLQYLQRLLDWADERSITVILVDMPVSADLERSYLQAFAEYRARLQEVVRNRNAVCLRADRDLLGLADSDFADLIHVNAAGSERISQWLRQALENCAWESPLAHKSLLGLPTTLAVSRDAENHRSRALPR